MKHPLLTSQSSYKQGIARCLVRKEEELVKAGVMTFSNVKARLVGRCEHAPLPQPRHFHQGRSQQKGQPVKIPNIAAECNVLLLFPKEQVRY